MTIFKAKISKIQIFFYSFWKLWTTNTLSLNSWVDEAYVNIRLENGYTPKEKHNGEDLYFEQGAVIIEKYKKIYI